MAPEDLTKEQVCQSKLLRGDCVKTAEEGLKGIATVGIYLCRNLQLGTAKEILF